VSPWLHIVGIGEDGVDGLSSGAREVLQHAEIVVGGERHLAFLTADDMRRQIRWPSPFDALTKQLRELHGRQVCVLASGDPLSFGVAKKLAAAFSSDQVRVWPALSAFTLARSRLLWSEQDVTQLSVHGRSLSLLRSAIRDGARVLALTSDGDAPRQIAAWLCGCGFGASELTVLERLGGPFERVRQALARDYDLSDVQDLNVVAIACSGPQTPQWSPVSGLPDLAFRHDGQLTKQAVRAATVAALAPMPGELLWDVGAGCGSVAIEWTRAASQARAIAVEAHAERLQFIAENAAALGVSDQLTIVSGRAPAALDALPMPDAVFVGGAVSDTRVIETCWNALRSDGRLVANGVTLQAAHALFASFERWGGELRQIAVSQAAPAGRFAVLKPAYPVTQWILNK
jgi:precorrin-6B C5,15-methyltransferase / cobalt-precorrin-6B C5,C15-methyltransferase